MASFRFLPPQLVRVIFVALAGLSLGCSAGDGPPPLERDVDDAAEDETEDDGSEDDDTEDDSSAEDETEDDERPRGRIDAGGAANRDASVDASAPLDSDSSFSESDAASDGSSPEEDAAGAGPDFPPFETNGEPLTGADREWTYVEFPDTQCRDGSAAGLGVSLNSASKKVMIYLEGGGACWDSGTCLINPANANGMKGEKTGGVFDRSNSENPVRDWNFIYVPYCTGDTHGGANPNGSIPGVAGTQRFVGYLNMQKFLQRVVPTFEDAEDVILTGISAGGFGTAQNAVLVQRAFADVKVKVIDDSGPPLSKAIVPECLQKRWRETWNLDETFLKDCGDACPNRDDFTQDYALFLAKTFDDRPSGLISADEDGIIAGFFGAGRNNCTGAALLTPVPGAEFKADLLAYREKVKVYPSFGTFFAPSTNHTWIGGDAFYSTTAEGVKLVDWFAKIVDGESPGHVGP